MSATLTSGTYPRRTTKTMSQGLAAFGRRLWAALMAAGQRRAAPHLEALALQYQDSDPALAAHLRRAAREGLL